MWNTSNHFVPFLGTWANMTIKTLDNWGSVSFLFDHFKRLFTFSVIRYPKKKKTKKSSLEYSIMPDLTKDYDDFSVVDAASLSADIKFMLWLFVGTVIQTGQAKDNSISLWQVAVVFRWRARTNKYWSHYEEIAGAGLASHILPLPLHLMTMSLIVLMMQYTVDILIWCLWRRCNNGQTLRKIDYNDRPMFRKHRN